MVTATSRRNAQALKRRRNAASEDEVEGEDGNKMADKLQE